MIMDDTLAGARRVCMQHSYCEAAVSFFGIEWVIGALSCHKNEAIIYLFFTDARRCNHPDSHGIR